MKKGPEEKSPKVFIGFNVTFPEGTRESKKDKLSLSESKEQRKEKRIEK
jgi:hypothetical protein